MANGPALALRSALVARLRADADVASIVGQRVFSEAPDGAALPMVQVGNINVSPVRMSGCTDEDIAFSIQGHSRQAFGGEPERLANAIRVALDEADFTVAGYHLDWCQWLTQDVTRGQDGKTYIATVAFQAALSAAP